MTQTRTARGRKIRMRQKLIDEQGGLCAICNRPITGEFNLDHIIPKSLGGPWTDWNLQAVHELCNLQKDSDYDPAIHQVKKIREIVYPPVDLLLRFVRDNPGDTLQTIAIGLDAVVCDTYRNLCSLYSHGKVRFEKPTWTSSGDYLFWKWYAE